MTALAVEILTAVLATVMTVADQGMHRRVWIIEVATVGIRTGMALSGNRLSPPAAALKLRVEHYSGRGYCRGSRGGLSALRAVIRSAWAQRPSAAGSGGRGRWTGAEPGEHRDEQDDQEQDMQGGGQ